MTAPHTRHAGLRQHRYGAWYWLEFAALLATIPAFYAELLAVDPLIGMGLYGFALACCSAIALREWQHPTHRPGAPPMRPALNVALVLGLGLCVILPRGESAPVLGVRLITAVLIMVRLGESLRPLFWRGGLAHLLTMATGTLGLCGAGFWWLEPRVQTLGDGLWLAFTTAATVGYGDIVPSTPASKIFAVFVVLMGFATLSLVTAAIAAMWVESEERRIEREILHDMHRELKLVRDELAALRAQVEKSGHNSSASDNNCH